MNDVSPQNIPFRLTIGVTGHRSLNDTETIHKTVRTVIDDVLARFPGTDRTEVKLCCLSPLAEGADRLVAEEVLRYPDATLKAVLPLTVDDYRQDFKTPESQQEFSTLLEKSKFPLSLRDKALAEEYLSDLLSEARSQAYDQVGKFVVQNCDILIGIWDGEDARGRAGTANIIDYAEKQECPRYIINTNNPETFEFIEDNCNIEAFFAKVDRFNAEKRTPAHRDSYINGAYKDLFDNEEGASLSEGVRERVKQYLLPFYADASTMAKHYQKIYRLTGLTVFWLAFMAMALVGTGTVFFNAHPVVFIIEFFILAFIAGLIFYADTIKRSHKNWMQYRFLAERIRSAQFMTIGGLAPTLINTTQRSGDSDGTEAWMEIVFEEICIRMPSPDETVKEDPDLVKKYIEKAWIDDQIDFHQRAHEDNRKKSKRLERLGEVVFFCAMAAAATHVIAPVYFDWFHTWFAENSLTLIALVLPTLGATIESIRSHRAYKHIARSSHQMHVNLANLKSKYQLYSPALLERYMQEAEHIMLKESEEWLALMSFSELYKAV